MWNLTIVYKMPRSNAVFIKHCISFEEAMGFTVSTCTQIGMSKIISVDVRPVSVG